MFFKQRARCAGVLVFGNRRKIRSSMLMSAIFAPSLRERGFLGWKPSAYSAPTIRSQWREFTELSTDVARRVIFCGRIRPPDNLRDLGGVGFLKLLVE